MDINQTNSSNYTNLAELRQNFLRNQSNSLNNKIFHACNISKPSLDFYNNFRKCKACINKKEQCSICDKLININNMMKHIKRKHENNNSNQNNNPMNNLMNMNNNLPIDQLKLIITILQQIINSHEINNSHETNNSHEQ